MMFKRLMLGAMAVALFWAQPNDAIAQSQLTIVVPFAAGGTSDAATRAIAQKVEEQGGPKIVIENRPGGGGVTAAQGVKDSTPDGRTLFLANYATFVINPAMGESVPFNPATDFQHITTLFSFPLLLTVPAALEAQNVQDLVALAKRKPEGLSYASQGLGTAGHLLGELLARGSGAKLLHIPYKGASQGVIDLVAGRVDLMFIGSGLSKAHRDGGRLRALAATSHARLPSMADVPTMAESGYPDVNTDFVWFGLSGAAKTPDSIVRNLNQTFAKALADPDLQARLEAQGVSLGGSTPEAFVTRIKADGERFGPLVKASAASR